MIVSIGKAQADRRSSTPSCAWICQIGGRVVGLARLEEAGSQPARIVSFRVDPRWSHTSVPAHLIRSICQHCQRRGYGQVFLKRDVVPRWMLRALERQGFRFLRSEETRSGPTLSLSLCTCSPESA